VLQAGLLQEGLAQDVLLLGRLLHRGGLARRGLVLDEEAVPLADGDLVPRAEHLLLDGRPVDLDAVGAVVVADVPEAVAEG